jgi:uncharacterized damage-inducible protein DinB
MPTPTRISIEIPPGYKSREVALFVAQLEDQTRRLREATRDLTPDELEWQPHLGMNTIGMLLAHLAVVEVWWTSIVVSGEESPKIQPILGIGEDDDGLPLAEGAKPPAPLTGKDLAFYDDLLGRARAFYTKSLMGLQDSDLERETVRTRPDGTQRAVTVRWFLYHVNEHFSGHFGQILLLRHLYRTARVPARA